MLKEFKMRHKKLYSCKMLVLFLFTTFWYPSSDKHNAIEKENVDKDDHSEFSGTNRSDEVMLQASHKRNPCQT